MRRFFENISCFALGVAINGLWVGNDRRVLLALTVGLAALQLAVMFTPTPPRMAGK